VSPPDGAADAEEGYCEECTEWYAWPDLTPCSDCRATLCDDHVDQGDHDCPGPEAS
jgi:hypothetical protein